MKAIVIGIGNEYRHDDGVGPEVIARLAALDLPDVHLAVTDGEPTELIDLWSGADVGVVVDAVHSDPSHPGKIHEFIVDRPPASYDGAASSHGLGLGEAIDLAVALGRMPRRLVVLAVEGADFSIGIGLTPQVAAALNRVVQLTLHQVGRDGASHDERVDHGPATEAVDWPLGLRVDVITAMMNFEIIDHPTYRGLEIQRFDDAEHGTGVLVMLVRTDGFVDVYHQSGLAVDPAAYGIAGGLGAWHTAIFTSALLEVAPTGLHADVRFSDAAGRTIEVQVDDRDGRARRTAALLAPVSAEIEHPTSMLLVWMPRFDLVRRTARPPRVQIDGRSVTIGRLPAQWLHRRHLIKYAADLYVVRLNPVAIDPQPVAHGLRLSARAPRSHQAAAEVTFSPRLPRPVEVADAAPRRGTWSIAINNVAGITGGTWSARRAGGTAELHLEVTRRWRPRRLPLLMLIVTTVVPVFRRWPTTYRWAARVDLGGHRPSTAGWRRTNARPGRTYQRVNS